MIHWEARGRPLLVAAAERPAVMAILNVTPDSFSDGGRALSVDDALEHARRLIAEGADLLDLGGESTRPGAEPVAVSEELRRVVPVVERLASETPVPISIDTSKAEVARAALERGASIVNDVTALEGDPKMLRVVEEFGAGVVLMHMRGTPRTMQIDPRYADVVGEVYEYLAGRIAWCEAHRIPRVRLAIDPGIGFGKTLEHNLELLRNLERFASLGCAVVIGTSRKGFLGKLTGRDVAGREVASVVSSLAACVQGASVVRVHDVGPMVDAIKVWTAILGWGANR
jgi:dihydropteroate synthase